MSVIKKIYRKQLKLLNNSLYYFKQIYTPGFKQPIFLTSIPKSGTHLTINILKQLKNNVGEPVHIDPYKPFTEEKIILQNIPKNKFAWGHLEHSIENEKFLVENEFRIIHCIRDPRSVVVSMLDHIDHLKPHRLKKWLHSFPSRKEKLIAIINGCPFNELPSEAKRSGRLRYAYPAFTNIGICYKSFMEWANCSDVLSIRYEDFLSLDQNLHAVERVYKFLGISFIKIDLKKLLNEALNAKTSTKYRPSVDRWREDFDDEVKSEFLSVTDDLLVKLKYEDSDDW